MTPANSVDCHRWLKKSGRHFLRVLSVVLLL